MTGVESSMISRLCWRMRVSPARFISVMSPGSGEDADDLALLIPIDRALYRTGTPLPSTAANIG
jgi:hypothetical protein